MIRPVKYWALCCLLLFVSCEMKKDLFGQGQGNEEESVPENVGLLDLHVVAEREAAVPGTKGDAEDENPYLVTDDFCVSILDSVGQVVKSYDSYAALKADGELLLPAGKYMIRAFSGDDPDAGFDAPYYEGDTTCVVSAKEVVKIETNCRLANKKVQFDLSDQFFDTFKSDYMIVVDNGQGVLTISSDELRSAYLRNTGTLRFTIYTTTYKGESYTYSCDLSKDEQIKEHNNLYIKLDAIDAKPDEPGEPSDPDNPDNPGPDEPSEPDEPEEPTDPDEPEYPSSAPTIKVDVSLVEKNYIIEVPSDFVEVDKPDVPDTPDGNEPGEDDKLLPSIVGQGFNISEAVVVHKSAAEGKIVKVNINTPGKLASLQVEISKSMWEALDVAEIDHSFDMCTLSTDLEKKLSGLGLAIPTKGAVSNVFDITSFVPLIAILGEGTYSFSIKAVDETGKSASATLTIEMVDK